jgi:hypothetical protein
MTLKMLENKRTLFGPQTLNLDGLSLLGRGCVQFGTADARVVSTHTAKRSGKSFVATTSALDSKRFSHDRAAATENL